MSHKSKNLQYEMEEPAFLRRLRQQHGGGGGPDRYIAPRNKKAPMDDEEDAPAYVMEGSEVSRAEFDTLTTGKKGVSGGGAAGEEVGTGEVKEQEEQEEKEERARKEGEEGRAWKENVAEIGGKGRKRKATKIGGDEEGEGEEEKEKEKEKNEGKGKKGKTGGKAKKRAVKLSFDQE